MLKVCSENFPVDHLQFEMVPQLVSPAVLCDQSATSEQLDDATRQCLRSQLEYYFSRYLNDQKAQQRKMLRSKNIFPEKTWPWIRT